MKDYTREELESKSPDDNEALYFVNHCWDKLMNDQHHTIGDEVVEGCDFNHLLSTLKLAKDKLEEIEEREMLGFLNDLHHPALQHL